VTYHQILSPHYSHSTYQQSLNDPSVKVVEIDSDVVADVGIPGEIGMLVEGEADTFEADNEVLAVPANTAGQGPSYSH